MEIWIIIAVVIGFLSLFMHYNPSIDIVFCSKKKYEVLLWYNKYEGTEINRVYIRLFKI